MCVLTCIHEHVVCIYLCNSHHYDLSYCRLTSLYFYLKHRVVGDQRAKFHLSSKARFFLANALIKRCYKSSHNIAELFNVYSWSRTCNFKFIDADASGGDPEKNWLNFTKQTVLSLI